MRYCRFILTLCLLLASSSYLYAVNSSESEDVLKLYALFAVNPECKWSFYSLLFGLVLYFVSVKYFKRSIVLYCMSIFLIFFGCYVVFYVAFYLLGTIFIIAYWFLHCIFALMVYCLAFSIIPILLLFLFAALFHIARIKINDKIIPYFFGFGIVVCFILFCMQPSETREKINFFPKESLFDVIHKAIYVDGPIEDYDLDYYD